MTSSFEAPGVAGPWIAGSSSSNPCRACQHPRDGERRMTAASTTFSALREGSQKGCATCYIFSAAIAHTVRHSGSILEDKWDSWVTFQFQMSYLGDALALYVISMELHISFFATTLTPWLHSTLPDLPLGRPVPASASSDASVKWARQQLQLCADSHSSCQPQTSKDTQFPRRLLDIRQWEKGQIRLFEPQTTEIYACLSYCWGRVPFLRTLKSNVSEHLRRINLGDLPRAFVDAISYTRRLDVDYLWIDSLCIIQDDIEDWKQESSRMASIYQNASIVLSASSLPNPHESLFQRMNSDFEAHRLAVQTSAGRKEEVWFRRSLAHMPSALHSAERYVSLPTLSRAWIFQERLLATRVLHFGPQELLWECLAQSACQCTTEPAVSAGNTAAPTLSRLSLSGGEVQLKSSFNLQSWASWDESVLSQCWHKLVEQYTKLNLTHESDIFPAFSGVAKKMQNALNSEYLAGMWAKTLLKDLLWHAESSFDNSRGLWERPSQWRAPTWSWASVRCPIAFIDTYNGLEAVCLVKEGHCVHAGVDATGEIVGAHLVLQGNLISTQIEYFAAGVNDATPMGSRQKLSPSRSYSLCEVGRRVHNIWADTDISLEGKGYVAPSSEVYILPIGVRTISKAVECLILKRLDKDGEHDTLSYERIGLLEMPRAPLDGLDEWMQPLRTQTIKII